MQVQVITQAVKKAPPPKTRSEMHACKYSYHMMYMQCRSNAAIVTCTMHKGAHRDIIFASEISSPYSRVLVRSKLLLS